MQNIVPGGLVHDLPGDLKNALSKNRHALQVWGNISVIARNEWICWTITVKQDKTRKDHVARAVTELAAGKRRPCCWVGCIHRTDKPASSWAQKVLIGKQSRAR